MVESCDASVLLDNKDGIESEKNSPRSFGMRNFGPIDRIKEALEKECPQTVSCADIVALSAREGTVLLGGPYVEMKTGRRDSKVSFLDQVESSIPNFNDSMPVVLSRFNSVGLDDEATVALLGAHSVGRVHCLNIVGRLYPTVDPTLNPTRAAYLKKRCPTPEPDPKKVQYSRTDLLTPAVLDNLYYKNILRGEGLLTIDAELATDNRTAAFVEKMAADNDYFHQQFARALLILSEINPLTGHQGEIRKKCRFVNQD
ncbi:OLC1v1034612C2 [Oldenlandia corymbosa var. corymbosa]|nr:OLC1v1034612C2 [Oldenlandia corymbosa var. corymbosa]